MSDAERPRHGDVWERHGAKFSVMHVCGHHDPPCVTGYWWRDGALDPCQHGAIPLPRFVKAFALVEREAHDAHDA